MAAPPIGSQNGIEGTRQRLQKTDPQMTDVPAFNRLLGKRGTVYAGDPVPAEGTLATLVDGHNESRADHARISDLEARVAKLESAPPFPAA